MSKFSYEEKCEMWDEVKEKVSWGGQLGEFSGTWISISGVTGVGHDYDEVFTFLEEIDFEYGWD